MNNITCSGRSVSAEFYLRNCAALPTRGRFRRWLLVGSSSHDQGGLRHKHFVNHTAVDVGESEISAGVFRANPRVASSPAECRAVPSPGTENTGPAESEDCRPVSQRLPTERQIHDSGVTTNVATFAISSATSF